jgi:hypothetical protein
VLGAHVDPSSVCDGAVLAVGGAVVT